MSASPTQRLKKLEGLQREQEQLLHNILPMLSFLIINTTINLIEHSLLEKELKPHD
jgi:hypothetical protein